MRAAGRLATLAAAYYAAHQLGHLFSDPVVKASPVWPATAVGVAAPVQRMNRRAMQTCVPTVIATANAVSGRLGYLPSRTRATSG